MSDQRYIKIAERLMDPLQQRGMLVDPVQVQAFLNDRLARTDFQIAGDGCQPFYIASDQIEARAGRRPSPGGRFSNGRSGADNQNVAHVITLQDASLAP